MTAQRSSLWKWHLCGLLFMQVSCTQPKVLPQPLVNPMDAAWSQIRNGINKLEDEHADEAAWRKASEPAPKVVSSIADLHELIKGLGITETEIAELPAAFKKSSRVIQFGFECDYHALVFFDETGKSWKVIKW